MLLCLPCLLLGFSSVAFAVGDSWYNVQFPDYKGVIVSNSGIVSSYVNRNEDNVFVMDNDAFQSHWVSFAFDPNWPISYSSAYDYWVTFQMYALSSLSDFTFYPSYFDVRYYDPHTSAYTSYELSDISFGHFDSYNRAGFSCFAKLPDNFNAVIHEMVATADAVAKFPADLRVIVQVYQVPKNDDGSSIAAAQVVAAIQEQTERQQQMIEDQTQDLIEVPDDQKAEAEQYVDDKTTELQDALTPLQAADRLSDTLLQTFQTTEKYNVHFPGLRGPFMPDGSTVTIIEEQDVDMSFMDRFSVITDAIGVVMLGLCGWKTLDFLYNKLMEILGKDGDSG